MPLQRLSSLTSFVTRYLPRLIPMVSVARSPSPSAERPAKRVRANSPKPTKPKAPAHPYPGMDEDDATLAARVEEIMAQPFEFERKYEYEVDYRDKLVLAPMVRTGVLPTRLLSLYYGAGLVWSPEIVDKAIIGATRTVDPESGVITYSKGQGPIFTCHPVEKPFLIFQIGSSNPDLAVQAAATVAQDVAGIDLNCGCPKPFSTHAGMGAALLSTPDLLLDILRALLANIALPISAKIRMYARREPTRVMVARLLKTGIRNLTVHCRTRDMRPHEPAMWEPLAELVALGQRRGVPVICNGDGDGWANWDAIRKQTNATSVMLARAAERNPSVFSPHGQLDTTSVVVPQLLNVAQHLNNNWGSTKFLLGQFKPSPHPIGTLDKAGRKEVNEIYSRGKTVQAIAEGLKTELGKGPEFMAELERRLKERPEWNVWEERRKAVAAGEVREESARDDTVGVEGREEQRRAEEEDVQREQANVMPKKAEAAPTVTDEEAAMNGAKA